MTDVYSLIHGLADEQGLGKPDHVLKYTSERRIFCRWGSHYIAANISRADDIDAIERNLLEWA